MKKRGRPKTTSGDKKACQLREANRRAYAKKNFQGNQHTSAFDKLWASLKEKHKEFEGTRLEKSIKKPIFLKEWDH